ncbi:acyltransferase family protein [Vibrio breoganii]
MSKDSIESIKPDNGNIISKAKGIGIILVIFGHMNIPHSLAIVIYSFHMPLFFYLSGLVFNNRKYNCLKFTIKRKVENIIISIYNIYRSIISLLYIYI